MKVTVQENEDSGQTEVTVSGQTMEQAESIEEVHIPKRSEFAAVVFDQTAETYPIDANVECAYTLTTDIQPSSRDWVGLFKVGWLSPRDYMIYEWAPVPSDYEAGKEAQAVIVFQADRLPKDDGEFYQFCYVSSSGNIRGASTPFQFKRPSAEDYVELEDSDNEMLVIRPKTAFLEEEVTKYKKLIKNMETEREGLVDKLRKARNRAESCSHEATQLRKKHEELTEAMRDMSMAHDEVKARLEMFEKERERLDDQVLQEEHKVKECMQAIRSLEAERDQLHGVNASLEAEVSTHREQIVELETELRGVTQQLQQTEDQLRAATEMKKLMEEEISAYKVSQEKLSKDLESAYSQNHALKEQLQLMEVGFADELKLVKYENEQREGDFEVLRKKLELVQQENFVLMRQLDEAEKNTHCSQEAAASLFALQKANDSLKLRHDKMSTALEEKEKELAALTRQNKAKEKELKREAEDCCQRVEMCKQEYKMLLAENTKLRHKLGKIRKRNNDEVLSASFQEEKSTETLSTITKTVACQKAPTLVNSSSGDACVSYTSDAATDTDSASNASVSPTKLEAVATELETRKSKKDKYKRLYMEEKERADMLRSHYYEEIERLKQEAEDEKANLKGQILKLEYLLDRKEEELEQLKYERGMAQPEDATGGHIGSYPEDKGDDASSDSTGHCLVHGNPYAPDGAAVYYTPTTEEVEQNQYYDDDEDEDGELEACVETDSDLDGVPVTEETTNKSHAGVIGEGWRLPPPLQPEVLPGARLAAVKQQIGHQNAGDDDQLFQDCDGYSGATPYVPPPPPPPAEHAFEENERFMDAIGEGMKICPVCETHIAAMSDAEFAEHVISHFGRLCPVCKLQADDSLDVKIFEDHVNRCIENARGSRVQ